MSEEEIIKNIKQTLIEPFYNFPNPKTIELKDTDVDLIESFLDLYQIQKTKIKLLQKQLERQIKYGTKITLTGDDCIPNVINIIKKDYISKDKIKAKIQEVDSLKHKDGRLDRVSIDFATKEFKELLEE